MIVHTPVKTGQFGVRSVSRPVHPYSTQPVKHVRYPWFPKEKRLTTCIAAACQIDGCPAIVLCADTRMSHGEYGSVDSAFKFSAAIPGWTIQFAGRPDSAGELIERLKEWFSASTPTKVHSVLGCIDAALKEFYESPLYEKSCCHLLISGFVDEKPVIIAIADGDKRKLAPSILPDFAAIGSGANIATVILNCRDYSRDEHFDHALYLLYEAKRFSEKADGVGPGTVLLWDAPGMSDQRLRVGGISPKGIEHLESVFQKTGLRSGVDLGGVPQDFFNLPEEQQCHLSTTVGQSLQRPSLE